jgi:hypothetical protein
MYLARFAERGCEGSEDGRKRGATISVRSEVREPPYRRLKSADLDEGNEDAEYQDSEDY